jgi:hypothetical protein
MASPTLATPVAQLELSLGSVLNGLARRLPGAWVTPRPRRP